MLGIEEMREAKQDLGKIQGAASRKSTPNLENVWINLTIENIKSWEESYHICYRIARSIIEEIKDNCNGSSNSTYGNKVRQIFYALKLNGK